MPTEPMIVSNQEEEGCGLAEMAGPFLLGDTRTLSEFLTTLRTNIETKLEKEEVKPSIGDYLKVLQLEKNFEEQPEEIQVRWVEPEESAEET
jgi:hypothetical protein